MPNSNLNVLSDLVRTLESDPEYDIAIPKLLQWADPRSFWTE